MSAWDELVELAEHELSLARGGRTEELPAALAERTRRAAALGAAPPAALPALQRLAAVQDQLVVELTLAHAGVARELASLGRGRGAVQGYRSAAGGSRARVDDRV